MNNLDKAIVDLQKIIESSKLALDGAVPMPIRTVKESANALTFEKEILDILHGFEVNQERAIDRINNCENHIASAIDVDPWAIDVVRTACEIMRIATGRYFTTCSERFPHGKR